MSVKDIIIRKLRTALNTKRILWKKIQSTHLFKFLPDQWAVRIIYRNVFERPLDLKNPKSYNAKLQWLKLYHRDPLYCKLVDKSQVKDWVASLIGEQYIVPTYGVYDFFEEIDFSMLPSKFVLKTTHGGGNTGVVICEDKDNFDFTAAKEKLNRSLKSDTYTISREWPYKNVQPRILVEEYIEHNCESTDLVDYKFYCFNGVVKALCVCTERGTGNLKLDYFDEHFNYLPFRKEKDHSVVMPQVPSNFELMKKIASKLSLNMPHVRVDLYDIGTTIYFGELTFFPGGGVGPFEPEEWDYKFGEWLTLPK